MAIVSAISMTLISGSFSSGRATIVPFGMYMCAFDDRLNITYSTVTGFLFAKVDMSGTSDLFFVCELTLAPSAGGTGPHLELVGLVSLLALDVVGTAPT